MDIQKPSNHVQEIPPVSNHAVPEDSAAPSDFKHHQRRWNNKGSQLLVNILVRLLSVVFLVPAVLLMATDQESKHLGGFLIKAKYSDAKAFRAFVAATTICGIYLLLSSIISLFFLLISKRNFMHNRITAWLLFVGDQVMCYLLLGATAASTEVARIAKHGFSKVGWTPVCGSFSRFCSQVAASLVMAYLAFLLLIISTFISALNLIHSSRDVLQGASRGM